jgi:hypothetical protein
LVQLLGKRLPYHSFPMPCSLQTAACVLLLMVFWEGANGGLYLLQGDVPVAH